MDRPRRVLILSVKAGAGHLRAAQAIEQALHEEHSDVEVTHYDALAYTNKAFRKGFTAAYETLAKELPSVWGFVYERLEETSARSRTKKFAQLFDNLNARPLWKAVKEADPDAIICTHYMPAEVVSAKRRKDKLRAPVSLTLTDYDIHSMWIQPGTDRYFVATEEMAYALRANGVDDAELSVVGIPILPVFAAAYPPKEEMRRRLGLRPDATTVLVSAGGFGLGQIHKTVAGLADSFPQAQFVAIAGRSEALHKKLASAAEEHPDQIVPFGFVDNMHELMAASDLAVTKCGGLTSSECLAMGLPLVIVRPIPGQEERNADFLLESGAAVRAHSNAHAVFKVEELLGHPDRIEVMAERSRAAARPRAAYDIAATVLASIPAASVSSPPSTSR